MKQNSLLSLSFLVFIISVVLSCTDHFQPDPLPNRQRIKSLTQILPGNLPGADGATFVSDFTYDSENKLEFVKSYPVPASIPGKRATTHYSYDANKSLTEVHRIFNDGLGQEYYIYNIGSFGQITQFNYDGGGDEKYRMVFNYNGQQLESSSKRFAFSSVSFQQDIIYHFGGKNLGSSDNTTILTRNVSAILTSTSTYYYDDKINPFFGMPFIPAPNEAPKPTMGNFNYYTFSGGLDNVFYLNRNNVLSNLSSPQFEINYQYTYNSDGLPLTRNTIRKNTSQVLPLVEEVLIYQYETY